MRADSFFAQTFGSRTRAKDALRAGRVLRGGKPLSPSDEVSEHDAVEILPADCEYASRGGYKLARGLDVFGARVDGEVFADLGASTGGFTDVLLQRGAKRVYAVDVGESLLDKRLAGDARVVVMDKTNARRLTSESFPERIHGVVSDLSFISLKLVLPAVAQVLPAHGRAFVLFKPQFECGGKGITKNGILPAGLHKPLLADFYAFCLTQQLAPRAVVNAPLVPRKNIEYVVFLEKEGTALPLFAFLAQAEKRV